MRCEGQTCMESRSCGRKTGAGTCTWSGRSREMASVRHCLQRVQDCLAYWGRASRGNRRALKVCLRVLATVSTSHASQGSHGSAGQTAGAVRGGPRAERIRTIRDAYMADKRAVDSAESIRVI